MVKTKQLFCPYCYRDRTVTTNGKCVKCGALLEEQTRCLPAIQRIEKIIQRNNGKLDQIPVLINRKFYWIKYSDIKKFEFLITRQDKVRFIDHIKKTCDSFPM